MARENRYDGDQLTRTSLGANGLISFPIDVVISQWLGFPKTVRGHYLTDGSTGTASEIFRNICKQCSTTFRRRSLTLWRTLMLKTGITPVGERNDETDSKEDKGFFWRSQRKSLKLLVVMQKKKAIVRLISQEKQKDAWDTFKRLVWLQSKNDSKLLWITFYRLKTKSS